MGKLCDSGTIPHLVKALTDSNRMVRMRAAEGLVDLKFEIVPIFKHVVKTGDRYGLHAFLAALENANLLNTLDAELRQARCFATEVEREDLLAILRGGTLPHPKIAAVSQVLETAPR
jgi:hypothetical protein